ncbi:MAG: tetratricopeptide (TPR) repeat protein [Verrucomicrobiales bacterium]|jgi:tetratricopeptide (TPR) repeat protein
MLEFRISLTHSPPRSPRRQISAWILPGGDVESWVRTLCVSGLPNLEAQPLFVLPESRSSSAAAGLFVPHDSIEIRPPARALGYALEGNRIFIPVESQLRYPLTEAEFASHFLHDYVVFHPAIGLVGFDASDALTLPELLARPKSGTALWNRAHVGLPPEPDKIIISVIGPPTDVIAESQDDIGSKPQDQLPGYAGEPKDSVFRAGQRKILNSIRNFADRAPEGKTSGPTWVDKLGGWARSKLEKLRDRQQREVDRLLSLLETNPDEGLRFALPIGGADGGRGLADPGANLDRHDVDFRLGELGGGRPISPWILDHQQLARLQKSYREAANRELNLGRYRRAAYIFGQLLADFDSAANALEQGGFFREAAALYQKHLGNDRAAAECLRKGGLFEEAVRVYESFEDFETVGDLYAELDRDADAKAAWERAVDQHLASNQPLPAQQLLETKLRDPRRALLILLAAWRESGPRAAAALRESFHLRTRYGWHAESAKAIEELRDGEPNFAATEVLCDVARFYPEPAISEAAADSARVLAGLQIQKSPSANQILRLIRSLEPDDLLLERDTRRFAKKLGETPLSELPPSPDATSVTITLRRRTKFESGFRAQAAVAVPNGLVVGGRTKNEQFFYLSGLKDLSGSATGGARWKWLELISKPDSTIVLAAANVHFPPVALTTPDKLARVALGPVNAGDVGVAFNRKSGDEWRLAVKDQEIVLQMSGQDGELRATHHFTSFPPGIDSLDIIKSQKGLQPMAVIGDAVFMAFGNAVARFDGVRFQWLNLPSPVRRLVAANSPQPRLLIGMENGAGIARLERGWRDVEFFESAAENPFLIFTHAGFLISVTQHKIRVFSDDCHRVEIRGSIDYPSVPIALLPGEGPAEFRLITEKERVEFELK